MRMHRGDFLQRARAEWKVTEQNEQMMTDTVPRCTSIEFIQLIEMCICFHHYITQKYFWKCDDDETPEKVQESIQTMQLQIKTTIGRLEGNGWKYPKFHELLHLVCQTHEFGRPTGCDTEVGERGLSAVQMAGRDKEKKTSSKITRSIGTTIQRGILLQ